jgi:hypothetical protein
MDKLEIISLKVVSYCEIPEELTENHWLSENQPDSYVRYKLNGTPTLQLYTIDDWLFAKYPELIEEREIFIHIDY